jgi:hypothetical protein
VLVREIEPRRPPVPVPPQKPAAHNLAFDDQVQNALNLYLPLKTPAQLPALRAALIANAPTVQRALRDLNYVHFARFLPSPDGSALWVVTSYDGGLHAYVMDFVAVLGDVFTDLLQFVRDAPRLPVQKYPRDFVAFIDKHNVPTGVWSAYPQLTVIDIQQATREAAL